LTVFLKFTNFHSTDNVLPYYVEKSPVDQIYHCELCGWVIVVYRQMNEQFVSYFMAEQVTFRWDDDNVCFLLDQHT